MWAEEFSRFSSLAPQNFLQFVVHVHVLFHNSASHSICAAQTEWLTFKMYYTDIYMTWVTPKTKAESYHEDFKSLLVVHKKNHSQKGSSQKNRARREMYLHISRVLMAAPNAGFTSSRADKKSLLVTLMFSSFICFERSAGFNCLKHLQTHNWA